MPRYQIRLPDPAQARGSEPSLSFSAHGADAFAEQLQDALRTPALFERWRALQPEPDEVDPSLGATDPAASVSGEQRNLSIDLVALTTIPGDLLQHRLRLLAGNRWELRNVSHG
ncbi:hypothetical protein [Pseudoxanthomonas suwonensis]|uniref:Uncharacterized protein n=1 Tax=Pseudoxanthomonas suwonensis TaxID=314722 RepID=A0A0E3Z471_9GAMM|nr:hypothetical protein [Pseudoxanthomonas suwonensis]AKC88322.1 hypothetical protein WQ53_09675 [Pseudoxanthomonas suwonensis]